MTIFRYNPIVEPTSLLEGRRPLGYERKDKACIFIGPSAWNGPSNNIPIPVGIDVFGPAPMGAIHQAVLSGYTRIGLVDGVFGLCPSVWHKEILFALSEGVTVLGAASMGALRACELAPFGMQPVGAIANLYRRGSIVADDEVCLLHLDRTGDFRPMTMPLIDCRFALRRLRRARVIGIESELEIISRIIAQHYSKFTKTHLQNLIFKHARNVPEKSLEFDSQKNRDARLLIWKLVKGSLGTGQSWSGWRFPLTSHWRRQFIEEVYDLPSLDSLRH